MRNAVFGLIVVLAFAGTVGLSGCGASEAERDAQAERERIERTNTAHREAEERVLAALTEEDRARYRHEMYRVNQAREYGIADEATDENIQNVHRERSRIERARELRLPESTPWARIFEVSDERREAEWHADRARRLRVPVTTSEEEPTRLDREADRVRRARSYGLPDTATWDEIYAAGDEERRLREAREFNLPNPERATEAQINAARRAYLASPDTVARLALARLHSTAFDEVSRLRDELKVAERRLKALNYDLPISASDEDIEKYEVERVRRRVAIVLNLSETAGWGDIYNETDYRGRF